MTWKKLNNAHFGSTSTFGGADIDKISKLFDGTTDIDEQDINSSTTIRSSKFKFRNLADTYSYTLTPSAIVADRTVTLPALTQDSEFLFENTSQTISNKTLSDCTILSPTFVNQGPGGTVQDPSIKRWGTYQPIGASNTLSGVGKLDGLLSRHIVSGDAAATEFPSGYPLYVRLSTSTATESTCGLFPNTSVPQFRTAKAGRIHATWMDSHGSFVDTLIGLSTRTTILSPGQPLDSPSGDQGFLFGHLGNSLYAMYCCNGSVASYRTFVGPYQAVFKDFELSWPAGGSPMTCQIGSQTIVESTAVPNPNTSLYFWLYQVKHAGLGTTISAIYLKSLWIDSE